MKFRHSIGCADSFGPEPRAMANYTTHSSPGIWSTLYDRDRSLRPRESARRVVDALFCGDDCDDLLLPPVDWKM